MKTMRVLTVVLSAVVLTGCLQVEAVHELRPMGESDAGSYRIGMSAFTYGMVSSDPAFNESVNKLRRFSRPSTRFANGRAYIEDATGTVSAEHMYDTFNCTPAPIPGYVDCRFAVEFDAKDMTGWSVDWDVTVAPTMTVLQSNHQRVRTSGGRHHLIWFFDDATGAKSKIDFTVRAPRA